MAQSRKCLPHKPEDLSWDLDHSSTHTSEPGTVVHICDHSTRRAETVDPMAHWLASLANWRVPGSGSDFVSTG